MKMSTAPITQLGVVSSRFSTYTSFEVWRGSIDLADQPELRRLWRHVSQPFLCVVSDELGSQ